MSEQILNTGPLFSVYIILDTRQRLHNRETPKGILGRLSIGCGNTRNCRDWTTWKQFSIFRSKRSENTKISIKTWSIAEKNIRLCGNDDDDVTSTAGSEKTGNPSSIYFSDVGDDGGG